MRLERRFALVIGGGAGLGRATAVALAEAGAVVSVADLNEASAAETVSMIPAAESRGLAVRMDIANPTDITRGYGEVTGRFQRLDIVVNCAAICLVDQLLELTPARWDRVFSINARGAFFCMQAAAKVMIPQKFGRIINVSTPASKMGFPLFATYGASKAALDSLVRSAALAWAPHGITVNSIVPGRMTGGMVDVLEQDLAAATGATVEDLAANRTRGLPFARRVEPSEVATAAVWLASDAAGYVTAERLNFTGGMELQ